MPTGIELYDRSGNVMLTMTDRVFKAVGVVSIPAGTTGSVAVSQYGDSNNLPAWVVRPPSGVAGSSTYMPAISYSGTTLSWSPSGVRGQGAQRDVVLEYGYF